MSDRYDALVWVPVSGKMEWQPDTVHAILTGIRSWITVIEITRANDLVALCEAAGAIIQETPTSKHYVFQYEPSLMTKQMPHKGVNVYNDRAKIFCAPNAGFEWKNLPTTNQQIPKMPLEIRDYIWSLSRSIKAYMENPEVYAWNILLYSVQFSQEELLRLADWICLPEMIRYQKSVTRDFLEEHFAKAIDDSIDIDWRYVEKYVFK